MVDVGSVFDAPLFGGSDVDRVNYIRAGFSEEGDCVVVISSLIRVSLRDHLNLVSSIETDKRTHTLFIVAWYIAPSLRGQTL